MLIGYPTNGTCFIKDCVKKYEMMRHRPGGAELLDPLIEKFIQDNVKNKLVIDIGCGAAFWVIKAAQAGAKHVAGVDIQQRMIEKGFQSYQKEGLTPKEISLSVDDVNYLIWRNKWFDCAMSILLGCTLPSLKDHIYEMARILKIQGRAIFAAPTSLDIVFTLGNKEIIDTVKEIYLVLEKIDVSNPNSIIEHLSLLTDVCSATFFESDGKLKLLTEDIHLENGTKIWRKLSANVTPNFYHSEYEYFEELRKAGFAIVKVNKPKFNDKVLLEAYNNNSSDSEKLNAAYIQNSPFMLIEVLKCKTKEINSNLWLPIAVLIFYHYHISSLMNNKLYRNNAHQINIGQRLPIKLNN